MIPSHCVGCPAASALAAKRRECAGHEKRQDTHSLSTALLPTGPVLLTEGRRPAGAEGWGPPAARSPGRECRRRRRSRIHGRRRVAHGTAVSVRRTRTCRWPRGSWRGRLPSGWLECGGAGPPGWPKTARRRCFRDGPHDMLPASLRLAARDPASWLGWSKTRRRGAVELQNTSISTPSQVMVSVSMATSLPFALKSGPSHLLGQALAKVHLTFALPESSSRIMEQALR
jgi:hypothetical protein